MSATSSQGNHMVNVPVSVSNCFFANLANAMVTIVDDTRIYVLDKCVFLPCPTGQLSIAS